MSKLPSSCRHHNMGNNSTIVALGNGKYHFWAALCVPQIVSFLLDGAKTDPTSRARIAMFCHW